MIVEFIFALLFLLAPLFLAKSMMPAVYAFGWKVLRSVWRLFLWMLYNTLNLPTPENRRRRRRAERFVPKWSNSR